MKRRQQEGERTAGQESQELGVTRAGQQARCGHYLLEAVAPHTVLPAPVCALGGQAGGAVGEEVTGTGAGQRGR